VKLSAAEIRLLKAARKLIEGGEPVVYLQHTLEPHEVSLYTALGACEKYFHGSHTAYAIAKDRLDRYIAKMNERGRFWSHEVIRGVGYSAWREIDNGDGTVRIMSGNISEETFNNWKVLVNLAYIDRILESGEVT
jgi:hypothetical protein